MFVMHLRSCRGSWDAAFPGGGRSAVSFLHVTLHQTRDTAFAPETSLPHGHLTVTRSRRDTARPPVSSLVWPSSSVGESSSCSPRDAISALAQAELSVWTESYE